MVLEEAVSKGQRTWSVSIRSCISAGVDAMSIGLRPVLDSPLLLRLLLLSSLYLAVSLSPTARRR